MRRVRPPRITAPKFPATVRESSAEPAGTVPVAVHQ
jgi:hypothetical protein